MAAIDKIKTILEGQGYTVERRTRTGREYLAIVTSKGTNRRLLLEKDIAPLVNGTFKNSGSFSRNGEVTTKDRVSIVAKDATPIRMTGFDARTFTKKARIKNFEYQGESIKCFHFDSAKQIEESVLVGMDSNESLRELKDSVENFFKTGSFAWPSTTTKQVTDSIGVYLGEILSGWVALSGNTKHIQGTHPIKGKVTDFYLPDDPSFSGVDSFIVTTTDVIGVSSKAGVGAAASYLTNVAEPASKRSSIRNSRSTLGTLANLKVPLKKAKEAIYEWGVNELLKLNIKDPHKLIDVIEKGETSEDLANVLTGVKKAMKPYLNDPPAKLRNDGLPQTLSACFNYLLAKNIEADSLEESLSILGAKSFWQFNLDQKAFFNGQLKFTAAHSGDVELKIIYKKSPTHMLVARNGWVNYEIKKK